MQFPTSLPSKSLEQLSEGLSQKVMVPLCEGLYVPAQINPSQFSQALKAKLHKSLEGDWKVEGKKKEEASQEEEQKKEESQIQERYDEKEEVRDREKKNLRKEGEPAFIEEKGLELLDSTIALSLSEEEQSKQLKRNLKAMGDLLEQLGQREPVADQWRIEKKGNKSEERGVITVKEKEPNKAEPVGKAKKKSKFLLEFENQ